MTHPSPANDTMPPKMGSLSMTFAAVQFTQKEEAAILRFTRTHDEGYKARRDALIRINAVLRACFKDQVLEVQNTTALDKQGRDWLNGTIDPDTKKSMMDLLLSGDTEQIAKVEKGVTAFKEARDGTVQSARKILAI